LGKDEHLWPVCLAVSDHGRIAVSDAHTGKISFLEEDLTEQSCMGGNGPDFSLFNMPYGVLWESSGAMLVVDTFKARVLRVDPAKESIEQAYALKGDAPADPLSIIQESPREAPQVTPGERAPGPTCSPGGPSFCTPCPPLGTGYDGYTDLNSAVRLSLPMLGGRLPAAWRASYARLVGEPDYVGYLFGAEGLLTSSLVYFVSATDLMMDGMRYTILTSPQCATALVVREGVAVPVPIRTDVWLAGSDLITDGAAVPVARVARAGARKLAALEAGIRSGKTPVEAMRTAVFLLGPGPFRERFSATFITQEGKEFAAACLAAQDAQQMREAALRYLESQRGRRSLFLPELFMAHMVLCPSAAPNTTPSAGW
jgi:hypothetical protein